jgi:hypothetical protein
MSSATGTFIKMADDGFSSFDSGWVGRRRRRRKEVLKFNRIGE